MASQDGSKEKETKDLLRDSKNLGNSSSFKDTVGDTAIGRANIECHDEFGRAGVRLEV